MLRIGAIALLAVCAVAYAEEELAKGFSKDERVVYKTVGDRALHMYVAKPSDWKATDSRGAVVFFHGGGWRGGKPSQFTTQAAELAKHGVVCFAPEYRFAKRDSGLTPLDCITDAKSAMRWVRAHAVEYGLDPDRIAAGGGSAGGHLAAAVAIVPGLDDGEDDMDVSPVPAALVLFNPAVDLNLARISSQVAMKGSPQSFIAEGNPPTIIFHGTDDKTVPIALAEKFTETMVAKGNVCELVPYEGAKHGFFNPNKDRKAYHDTTRRMVQFLREEGIVTD